MNRFKLRALAKAALFLCAVPGVGWAQTATPAAAAASSPQSGDTSLGTVEVTATKTGRTAVQTTPIAVAVHYGAQLDAAGVTNIADLQRISPSLKVGEVTASPSVYIRGIGTNNVFNGSDPNVAVLLDGVYLARPFQQYADFIDVERVEVLRGPQGTTFGRNAVGGVLNIISVPPTNELDARVKVSAGNYGLLRTEGYVSGPLVKNVLAASIAVNKEYHGPYNENVVAGQGGVADSHRQGLRAQLRWTPNAMVDATTRIDYSELNNAMQSYDHLLAPYRSPPFPPVFSLANSLIGDYRKVALDFPGRLASRGTGIAEDVVVKLGENFSLRSITAYRDSQYHLSLDADASEFRAAQIFQAEQARQFSQELNLVYNSKRFDGVVGLYYIREHNVTDNVSAVYTTRVYSHITPDLKASSKAAFAQGTYHFDNGLSVEFGGRVTSDTKRFNQNFSTFSFTAPPTVGPLLPGFPFIYPGPADPPDRKWSSFTPRVGANWKITPDVMPYVTYSEGFKSGGFNFAAVNAAGISFNPEKLKSFEAGVKTRWLDRKLLLNLTAFNYDYKDLQVQQAIAPGNVQIANAATARVRGLELESQARVSQALTLGANVTYLDAKYKSFPASLVPNALVPFMTGDPRFTAGPNTYNASGNRMNNAPRLSYTMTGRYAHPLGDAQAYVDVAYSHQSAADFDASNAAILREPGYGLTNLAFGYDSADRLWSAQLMVKNVFDKNYYVLRAANGLVPSAPSGAPRTVIFSVTRRL